MARLNKVEREKYGISIHRMSELSGLSVDRVKEIEATQLSLIGQGAPRDRLATPADSARMLEVVDTIKKEQDAVVEAMMGRLVATGVDISLKLVGVSSTVQPMYHAELSQTTLSGGSLVSSARGRSPLSAMTACIDTMREVVGNVSGLLPLPRAEAPDVMHLANAVMDTLEKRPSNYDIGKAIEGAILAERQRHAA